MNYRRQYELLIEKAQLRGSVDGYMERHHIVPRCMGGSNEKENLVELTGYAPERWRMRGA
jgi:5-methylcytosine-specific restriction endonuclease McrA